MAIVEVQDLVKQYGQRGDTWQLTEDVRARGVTVLLVTHSMEEAERLCDRIALIDAGRIVALDTPAGIVSRARLEQRVQFRASAPLNVELLTDLAEVHDVTFAVGLVVAALAPTARACTAPAPH